MFVEVELRLKIRAKRIEVIHKITMRLSAQFNNNSELQWKYKLSIENGASG
jgi:hypothetical protein